MHRLLVTIISLALVFTLVVDANKHLHGKGTHLPAYPLAVKNPYLSTWLSGEFDSNVTRAAPQFWNQDPITWNILARVGPLGSASAITYSLFGHPDAVIGLQPAVQRGPVNYTSTHTYVTLEAGKAQFILDFFSPVSPNNLVRQSMPYSYLTITASADKETDIQILSTIDHSWVGHEPEINANITSHGNTTFFTLRNKNALEFVERNERAAWGTTVFATQGTAPDELSSGCDSPQSLHSSFAKTGSVQTQPTCEGDDTFGLTHQLTKVKNAVAVTYGIGLYREAAVNYLNKAQTPYFRSQYKDIPSSINAFFADHSNALAESQSLDLLVRSHANQIGGANYSDILEASVRQTFGALEVVIPADTLSTAPQDVNGFLKEISSDGNVNSIDVIYPTMPLFYVLCPQWIKLLLQPVLEYLVHPNGVWDLATAPHDLGNHYPNATGHNENRLEVTFGREEWMPIEVTGSLMTMLLAYTNATSDYNFVKRYIGPQGKYLLTTYADALVVNGTYPTVQLTTVDALEKSANTTQLAIQAALGVSAMGAISNMHNYTVAGARMTNRILNDPSTGATDPQRTHFTYNFGDASSFSVMFPLFTDKLAKLDSANSFAASYDMQSNFYRAQLAQHPLGIPYSSKARWAVTDWNMWSAGITAPDVTKQIIDSTYLFLTTMKNGVVFGTKQLVVGPDAGAWVGNTARPTVGGNFALWALQGHSFKF